MFELGDITTILGVSSETITAGLPVAFIVIGLSLGFYILYKLVDMFNPFS